MKQLNGKLAVGILCMILGFILSVQFKTIRVNIGESSFPTQRAHQLMAELKNLQNEKERLNEELMKLERRLKEYEETEANENLIIKNLKNDLLKYQVLAGYKSIEGPGVVVVVDDPPQEHIFGGDGSFLMYNFDILLALINKLNAAGAEAISINDQRYIATTEMYFTSNALLINSVPITPPFVIKAIGNSQTLEAALNMRYGIVSEMRHEYNLQVNVKREENIVIPRYSKPIHFKYAKPIDLNL